MRAPIVPLRAGKNFQAITSWGFFPARRRTTGRDGLRALALLALLLLLQACSRPTTVPTPPFRGPVPVQAPLQISVGQPVTVTVGPLAAADGIAVQLAVVGSYGSTVYVQPVVHGAAHFVLPGTTTRHSGRLTLTAAVGESIGQAQMVAQPGPPVEPLTPLVGARSIIADGDHWAMAVLVPFDRFGNPVAEGTKVDVLAQHPQSKLEYQVAPVTHLLAWTRLWSRTVAGRTTVVSRIQTSTSLVAGPETELLEVPGWPVPFAVQTEPPLLVADGRRLMTLRTTALRDQYENLLPDGTIVTFLLADSGQIERLIPADTVDGIAEVTIQAAQRPVTYDVWATVYGVESHHTQAIFVDGPAVGQIPLAVARAEGSGALTVTIGPVLGSLGQYVPDGAQVAITLSGPGGSRLDTVILDRGYALLGLRQAELPPGSYQLLATAGSGQGVMEFDLDPTGQISRTPPVEAARAGSAPTPSPTETPAPPFVPFTPTPIPPLSPTADPPLTVEADLIRIGRVVELVGATVHQEPDPASPTLGRVAFDALVVVIGRRGDGQWLQIRWRETERGWLPATSLGVASADRLPVRE